MAIDPDAIDDAISSAASAPKVVRTTTATVEQHDLKTLIELAHLARAESAKSSKTHGFTITKAKHTRG